MLLRHKKTQGEEQNWCLILNPLKNEIDKKKIAQKIAQVFSLSTEEASDLVANTPIILLDNLTREVATSHKEYFISTGADMVLTNDILEKRKCYRTVWPEPPNLSFLLDWQSFEDKTISPQASVTHEEAPTQEIPRPIMHPQESFPLSERERLLEEIERWRKECLSFQDESRKLKEEIEKGVGKAILSQNYSSPAELEGQLKEKEKDLKELKLLYANSQEKNEMLKEETRESRNLYEEKIAFLTRENEQWKKKIQESTNTIQAAQQNLQKEKQVGIELLARKDIEIKRMKEDYEDSNRLLKENLTRALSEIEQAKVQSRQVLEKTRSLEVTKEAFDKKINEQATQLAQFQEKLQATARHEQELETRISQEKNSREKAERHAVELEQTQSRLEREMETVTQELRRWESRAAGLEKEIGEIRTIHENQEKAMQAKNQLIQSRERELDAARRQLREVNQHWEQREMVQRRTQVTSQLAEKENALKRMVREQEKIEREIREREESMRKILAEQEAFEKEIMEAKQAQRHLMEQNKRDQRPGGKIKIEKDSVEIDAAHQEAE